MTETLKKATTPRKPRATANGTEPKKAAARQKNMPSNVTEMKRVSHDQIAMLAHRFWTERGSMHGHDAEDWFRAERELFGKAS